MIKLKKNLLALFAGATVMFIFSGPFQVVKAEVIWFAVETTTAYKGSSSTDEAVFVVRQDQGYPVVAKTRNGWLKIRERAQSGKVGYVPAEVLRPRKFKEGSRAQSKSDMVLGVQIGFSYVTQPARTFKDATPAVDISTLTSSTMLFGAYFQFPIREPWTGRVGLGMRSLKLVGTTKVASGSVGTSPTNLQVNQEFIGIFGGLQYSLSPLWWVGGGIEADQATKSSVATSNQADQPEKPVYLLTQLQTGLNFEFGFLSLAPEVRLGLIANSTPMMITAEGALLLGYRF